MAAALAMPAFDPCGTLVRSGARLYAGRCLRAGQGCKLVLSRLAVRLDFTSVETEKFIIIYAVQIRL